MGGDQAWLFRHGENFIVRLCSVGVSPVLTGVVAQKPKPNLQTGWGRNEKGFQMSIVEKMRNVCRTNCKLYYICGGRITPVFRPPLSK